MHDRLPKLLASDDARVREQAVIALGICERAAEALLLVGAPTAVASVFDHVARTFDRAAAVRLAARITLPAQADERIKELFTDLSAAIVLWMKCLEGYMHAWLGPRFRGLAEGGAAVYEITGSILGAGWPGYQRRARAGAQHGHAQSGSWICHCDRVQARVLLRVRRALRDGVTE